MHIFKNNITQKHVESVHQHPSQMFGVHLFIQFMFHLSICCIWIKWLTGSKIQKEMLTLLTIALLFEMLGTAEKFSATRNHTFKDIIVLTRELQ